VNVRLIAATNRDLRAEVLGGRFREDLSYRLSSIQIRIPSLAGRIEDIPLLVQYFLKKYNHARGKKISGLMLRAQAIMLQHAWPGSVRELENVISSAYITAMGDFIDIADFPEQLQHRGHGAGSRDDWRPCPWKRSQAAHPESAGFSADSPSASRSRLMAALRL
jgi:DNA-binding NtrC family response regulator